MLRTTAIFLGCISLLIASATSSRASDALPARLVIQPAGLDLDGRDDRQRVLVTAIAGDGRVADVTTKAAFTSRQPRVMTVTLDGECVPVADGSTELSVTFGNLSTAIPVQCRNTAQVRSPSFVNHVVPLLTRQGCNQGACHGKNAGQNGFRLSLRGYAPEWDYLWITREYDGRRVNTAVPEDSLLLRKPLGLAPHEGGKLFGAGSREHRLLLDWVRAGAPGPDQKDPGLQRIEVLPGNRTLKVGQEQQLLVRAHYTDGRTRDVTWLAKFASNDAGMASVDAQGRVQVLRNGETAIRVAFQGLVAVVLVTVPYDRPVPAERLAQRNNFIDDLVFAKLAALRIEPSDLCADPQFVRRAYLDTIGTLPTPEEVRAFLADRGADKRARLIDSLLERPEFVDYWTLQLGDLFQNRKERDHDVRGTKGVRSFHQWLRARVAANTPWDVLAREVLTAAGDSTANPAIGYFVVTVGENREAERSEVVASAAQAFLGTRIGCAQCHNHPLEKYTQDDYYHFAAFFSRIKLERKEPKQGPTKLVVSAPDPNQNKNPPGTVQPRTGAFLKPQPLDRSEMNFAPGDDPRVKLAAWMTDPKNEAFSGAMVNRLWKHFFDVDLVEPVDDLRTSNPPSNPELWQTLNKEFVAHKYDLKNLMRLILNSRTYQLSAAVRPGNEQDTRSYAHYYARRLPAEVLLDALSEATGVPDAFPGYPTGMRAGQLPDPTLKSQFLTLFGRSERVTACACERNGEVTMPQLLHLMNGDSVIQKIKAPEGRLTTLLRSGKPDEQVIEELFFRTLSRAPSTEEIKAVKQELGKAENREDCYRDLFWALLNAKEFSFNH